MGRSHIYHVLGYGKWQPNNRRTVYTAMNRHEMGQAAYKALIHGDEIIEWDYQTKRGQKMVEAGPARVIPCEICNQEGCIVCKYSGVRKPGQAWINGWSTWQLDEIKKEHI